MSLSAVLLVKVLRDLPGPHRRALLALAPLAAVALLGARPAYGLAPSLGLVALALGSACVAVALRVVFTGYRQRRQGEGGSSGGGSGAHRTSS